MRTKIQNWGMASAILAGSFILGCAARQPVEFAQADLAIDHALDSPAPQLASDELRTAQSRLSEARDAFAEGSEEEARRLAQDALAQAQLAEAKADARATEQKAATVVTTPGQTTVIRRTETPRITVVP